MSSGRALCIYKTSPLLVVALICDRQLHVFFIIYVGQPVVVVGHCGVFGLVDYSFVVLVLL